jgi:hypothetical protein
VRARRGGAAAQILSGCAQATIASERSRTKLFLVLAALLVAGVGSSASRPSAAADPAAAILARLGSGRITELRASGGVAVVEGRASGPADAVRTLWYANLAGAALAQQDERIGRVHREVVGAAGELLERQDDAVTSGGPDAFAPVTASVQKLRARVEAAGARLTSAKVVALYGGAVDAVVQPDDPAAFVRSAGARIGALLGSRLPYLVTVVDRERTPLLVLGFSPGVGGGMGQGIAWVAPGVATDAVWSAAHAGASLR